jgi:hypothetical protein
MQVEYLERLTDDLKEVVLATCPHCALKFRRWLMLQTGNRQDPQPTS